MNTRSTMVQLRTSIYKFSSSFGVGPYSCRVRESEREERKGVRESGREFKGMDDSVWS